MSLVVYKSSAGSGKTTTLVNEYLSLALKNPDYFGSIIALTFTIKATREMKERVFVVLDKIIHLERHKDDLGLLSGIEHIKKTTGFTEDKIRLQAKILLPKILHQYSDFAFSTIDSFVVRIVRSFAHDLNLSTDFNIELDTDLLIEQALALLFEKVGEDQELTHFLIQYILQNVDNEKTLKIENDLADLGKILFDSKHYQSIDKIDLLDLDAFVLAHKALLKDIKSFESQSAKIAKEIILLIQSNDIPRHAFSRSSLPNQLDKIIRGEIDAEYSMFKNIDQSPFYPKGADQIDKDNIDAIRDTLVPLLLKLKAFIDSGNLEYHNKRLILEKLNPLALLSEIKVLIDQYSEENNIIHLSESNKKIAEIVLNEHIPFIYERVGRKYNHFLIDEFQDTSVIQWNNLLPLIDNSLSSNNFNMLVGDAKQSIYRWRDGDVDQFINLPKIKGTDNNPILIERERNLSHHIKEKQLQHNYRSELNIIEFNNLFFKYFLETKHQKSKDTTLRFLDSERVQNVYSDYEQIAGKIIDNGKVSIQNIPTASENTYHQVLVDYINSLLSQGYQSQDIAVIARSKKILHIIADILVQNRINIVSSESLFIINNSKVRLLVSIIKYIGIQDRKNNLLNMVHILSHDQADKGTEILHNIKSYIDQIGKNDDLELLVKVINQFGYHLSKKKLQSLQAYDLTEYLISQFQLNKIPNPFIQSLLNNILENVQKNGAGIKSFIDFWDSKKEQISISLPENIDAVKLLTIHRAKGLEFPVVIFPAGGFSTKNSGFHWVDPKLAKIDELEVAMIGHKKEMELSSYGSQYQDEKDQRNLDDINLIYVANTRPTEQLIILFEGDKKDSLWKYFKEFKNLEHPKLKIIDDNHFEFGQMHKKYQSIGSQDTHIIKQLISSDWESKLKLKRISSFLMDDDQNIRIEKGKILHYLLSQIKIKEDIKEVVQKAQLQGIIRANESEYYETKLHEIISKPSISDFFKKENHEINETTIILPNGELRRPDKVIVRSKETIIIDYKLSNYSSLSESDRDKYAKQINEYRDLLISMNYPDVKAYLIYMDGEIKNIEVPYST